MNPDEIRIAVAEARGWVWYRMPGKRTDDREYRFLAHPDILEYPEQSPEWIVRSDGSERACSIDYMEREHHLPKVDLNEMHEVEKLLTIHQLGRYEEELYAVTHRDLPGSGPVVDFWNSHHYYKVAHADSGQRAEAFLRTLGKWKEP